MDLISAGDLAQQFQIRLDHVDIALKSLKPVYERNYGRGKQRFYDKQEALVLVRKYVTDSLAKAQPPAPPPPAPQDSAINLVRTLVSTIEQLQEGVGKMTTANALLLKAFDSKIGELTSNLQRVEDLVKAVQPSLQNNALVLFDLTKQVKEIGEFQAAFLNAPTAPPAPPPTLELPPPPAPGPARLPKVGIVGLKAQQAEMIRKEFGHTFELTIWALETSSSDRGFVDRAQASETLIIMKDHTGSMARLTHPNPIWLTGGMTTLRTELARLQLAQQLKG